MFGYLIAFGIGYFIGRNGMPQVMPGPNGGYVVTPGTGPTTYPAGTPQTGVPSWSLPAGYTIDANGNVYDPRGVLVIAAGGAGGATTAPGYGPGYAQPGSVY